MVIQASDAHSFIKDPQVRTAVTESVAALAAVPVSYVKNVSFIHQPQQADSNGGSMGGARRLQGSPVRVDYTIAMPMMATGGAAAEGARIRDALGQAEPGAVTNLIVTSMGMATYNLSVTQILQPELRLITVSTSLPVASFTSTTNLGADTGTLVPLNTTPSQVNKHHETADLDWATVSLVTGGVFVFLFVTCAIVCLPLHRQQQAQRMAATNASCNNVVAQEVAVPFEPHVAVTPQEGEGGEEREEEGEGNPNMVTWDAAAPYEPVHDDLDEASTCSWSTGWVG